MAERLEREFGILAHRQLSRVRARGNGHGVVAWRLARQFIQYFTIFQLETEIAQRRIGDLVVANAPGYGFNEEVSEDLIVFDAPLITGYKQAIEAGNVKGMWTPFIIRGPGVKKNFRLPKPIRLMDQYPTLMTLMGQPIPDFVEGRVLKESLTR